MQNPELQLAHDFIEYTNKNVFLTGKAGTGKTTFLHNLKKKSPKRMIVVAPTGVAAINAGGVTIHSFFQLSFGPLIPIEDFDKIDFRNFNQQFRTDKINIIKSLDLLVIDEISMVRADLLDGIDLVLRRYKNRSKPFGGVQLLMIGDLHQLAPVVKPNDWEILKDYYDSLFFFHSKALQKSQFVCIELKHIYRQSDRNFIELLNKVRNKDLDESSLNELNKRFSEKIDDIFSDGYITLTTHNAQAKALNDQKLQKISHKQEVFTAKITGEFPEYSYPTEYELVLKAGAQVMFVKNDISPDKLFYNGKIGKITKILDDRVFVSCPNELIDIPVDPVEWKNQKYSIHPETKEIEETEIGSFTQYPLKLAWAITIHKSQGLTFDKVIIDAQAAFSHGQVYVALSRCRTFEGIILSSKISHNSIKSNSLVKNFTSKMENEIPQEKDLNASKQEYEKSLVLELFDFTPILRNSKYCIKALKENQNALIGNIVSNFQAQLDKFIKEISEVSKSFEKQIDQILQQNSAIAGNDTLQERIKKACQYFGTKLDDYIAFIASSTIESDNKAVSKELKSIFQKIYFESNQKKKCILACFQGFDVNHYLTARAKSTIEEAPLPKEKKESQNAVKSVVNDRILDSELYKNLKNWRNHKAIEMNYPSYVVLHNKSIEEIILKLPKTLLELNKIYGISKKKIASYGDEILEIILEFIANNPEEKAEISIDVEDKDNDIATPKANSKEASLFLYNEGKSMEEIAITRGLAVSTIEGHLAHYVGIGQIKIDTLVDAQKLEKASIHFQKAENYSLKLAKDSLGDSFSWSELKFIFKHLQFENIIPIQKSIDVNH